MRSDRTGGDPARRSTIASYETFRQLQSVLPIECLDDASCQGAVFHRFGDSSLQQVARSLCRSQRRHVILTGDRGVGRTTVVRRLAREVPAGTFPRLTGLQFVRMDVSDIGPEDSRACVEAIVSALAHMADIVICLDGMASLFLRANGRSNKPLLRTLFRRRDVQVIGIMTDCEYAESISGDAQMLQLTSRVRLAEPHGEEALAIAACAASGLSAEFGVSIPPSVVERAVSLSTVYLLNHCHPSKAIDVLRHACEDRAYEHPAEFVVSPEVSEEDVVGAVAELTDLPSETIRGDGARVEFESALAAVVVGQAAATHEVATELRLIAAGLSEPGKPASVLLFAGMTGVGKTELAKRIAELYSTSRRLNVYSMGNFTEPHSVSGLVGVPPGYVGHEHGGRLINDLNADPYSVFLLDEAEKCHPNIWKPFLHLFDEGWIVDQRGVKAYADRAIFILTTNAGDRQIAQLSKSGKSQDELSEAVRKALSRVRHERSSQVIFPPQFLARIKRIIVFRPLDADAMQGIAERVAAKVCRLWHSKQRKEVVIAPEVIQGLARRAHALNEAADGQEGGRIVRKLFADSVERTIQERALQSPDRYRLCTRITVEAAVAGDFEQPLLVTFESEALVPDGETVQSPQSTPGD